MEKKEIKKIISELLNEGNSLSDVQSVLKNEYSENLTFLDLRLMASELDDVQWDQGEEEEKEDGNEKDEQKEEVVEPENIPGKTSVEVSPLTRPGAIKHGSVEFGSGASAEWILDQMGRVGLEKSNGKPTETDLEEFQEELKKNLGA